MHLNPRAWPLRTALTLLTSLTLASLLLILLLFRLRHHHNDWDTARLAWQQPAPALPPSLPASASASASPASSLLSSPPSPSSLPTAPPHPAPTLPTNSTIKPLPHRQGLEAQMAHLREIEEWEVPAGVRVVGLVFYGRRRFVEVLNCYLERNLVNNGGIIDEYVFIVKTEDEADLAYLETLLQRNPGRYSKRVTDKAGFDYSQMWSVVEAGNIYVKIDDDVLYISDSTIRSIVKRKVEHPEYVMVSANLVVQFCFTYHHLHFGALHPYLPEISSPPPPSTDPRSTFPWRPSSLSPWSGPDDFNASAFEPELTAPHHRWLPVDGHNAMDRTPAADVSFEQGGRSWDDWRVGAQQHYSFLQNLERNELWRYHFEMWDKRYDRVSINLMAIAGDDILAMMPMPKDDEEMITQLYSKRTGKHVVIDGHGIAVHHGYYIMGEHDGKAGIESTDVLDRYRAYAQESICMP